MNRAELIYQLTEMISDLAENQAGKKARPIRVGIDGIDAAGKTTFADELACQFSRQGQTPIRATIDDFHNPKKVRSRQGTFSPQGYFEDSFNYRALEERLLIPLGPGGNRNYQTAAYDYQQVRGVSPPLSHALAQAILLFDGLFLQRPEIGRHWDFMIYIDIDFEQCLSRALARDSQLYPSPDFIERLYRQRYMPGQRLYLASCRPKEHADVVIDNNIPVDPKLVKWPTSINQRPLERCQASQ